MATSIVLADALATPVNHTFVFIGRNDQGDAIFEDQSATNPVGYWRIIIGVKRPTLAISGTSSKDRSYRVKVQLSEPVLETVSNNTLSGILPAPVVGYVPRAFVEYVIPERATLQNRKDIRKMIATLIQSEVQVIAAVESLVGVN